MIIPFKEKEPQLADDVIIFPGAKVIGDTVMDSGCSVWFNAVVRGDVNVIRIGKNVNVQDLSMIHCTTAKYGAFIGDDVLIGHRALIHGCTIGDRVLIGMGAIVMDGVKIGQDSIIGAGSLVLERSEFPPGVLILGSPAKIKRELSEEEIANIRHQAIHYRNLAESYRSLSSEER